MPIDKVPVCPDTDAIPTILCAAYPCRECKSTNIEIFNSSAVDMKGQDIRTEYQGVRIRFRTVCRDCGKFDLYRIGVRDTISHEEAFLIRKMATDGKDLK